MDQLAHDIPEDPAGCAITEVVDGDLVSRLVDGSEVGVYDTREDAVEEAEADPVSP